MNSRLRIPDTVSAQTDPQTSGFAPSIRVGFSYMGVARETVGTDSDNRAAFGDESRVLVGGCIQRFELGCGDCVFVGAVVIV